MRWEESRSSETNGTSIQGRDLQSEALLENRKMENTNSFYKASFTLILTLNKYATRKENYTPEEHRCKKFQQNISKTNSAKHKPWSGEIYSKDKLWLNIHESVSVIHQTNNM